MKRIRLSDAEILYFFPKDIESILVWINSAHTRAYTLRMRNGKEYNSKRPNFMDEMRKQKAI